MAKTTRKTPTRRNRSAPAKTSARAAKPVARAAKRAPVKTEGIEQRIARALEAIAAGLPKSGETVSTPESLRAAEAFVWQPNGHLIPVPKVSRVELGLLKG